MTRIPLPYAIPARLSVLFLGALAGLALGWLTTSAITLAVQAQMMGAMP